MPAAPVRNLEPDSIVGLVSSHGRAEFVARMEAPLLLVRIDDPSGEMAAVLREIATHGGARLEPTMGFETRSEMSDDAPRWTRRPTASFGAAQVAIRLVRGVHFAWPIRKRPDAGKAFSERVSLGRARNNDIVLRHESISKFHAWFRCDEDGSFYVGDAASRNGTKVNGEPLPAQRPHRLLPGDTIAFGVVEALFCPAGVLWDAVRSGA